MIRHALNNSIEGNRFSLDARRFEPKPPKKDSVLKKAVFRLSIADNAEAIIEKELNPKTALYNSLSHLNLDDGIHGEVISLISLKPIKRMQKQNKTGRHKAQLSYTRSYSFAKIDKIWTSIKDKKVAKISSK